MGFDLECGCGWGRAIWVGVDFGCQLCLDSSAASGGHDLIWAGGIANCFRYSDQLMLDDTVYSLTSKQVGASEQLQE